MDTSKVDITKKGDASVKSDERITSRENEHPGSGGDGRVSAGADERVGVRRVLDRFSPPDERRLLGSVLQRAAVIFIVGALVLGAVMWFWLGHGQSSSKTVASATPPPVVTVGVERAAHHPIANSVSVNGTIWPWDPLNIGAEINGLRIDKVLVEEGDLVRKGQILARLNSSVLEAQLSQEKARLRAGKASLKKAIQPNRTEDITSLKAALSQAEATVAEEEANLVKARANLANDISNAKRYRSLVSEGAVSEQEAEMRETQAKTAEAEVRNREHKVRASRFVKEQAEQKLLMAERGGRVEDVEISRAAVQETEANVRRLEAMIEQTIIRAPTDGLVMRRDAHLGDITAMNKNLFLMARDNRLELRAQVPEVDLPIIKTGQKVRISDSAHPDDVVFGTVREVSPMIDQDLRLGTVRIDLPVRETGKHKQFLPGNFVHGVIDLGTHSALAVPVQAVYTKDRVSHVFVLNKDGSVSQRKVKTRERQGGLVEVASGLYQGEEIVVKGGGFLKDGDYVRAKRAPDSAAGSKGSLPAPMTAKPDGSSVKP